MQLFRAAMAVLLFICLLPLMGMAVAEFIAQVYGCKLDLAGVHPCMVGGSDMGHTLLTLGMMGYFLFVTLPFVARHRHRVGAGRSYRAGCAGAAPAAG